MRTVIKTIWKFIMRQALKAYTLNPSLYINNNPQGLKHKKFYSQFGQDEFILKNIFQNKKEGVFVDVGANHPTNCSNTFLLEQNGWTGIAIEPQQNLRDLWPAARKTPCLKFVIGPENKIINFIEGNPEEHGLSGVEGFNKVKTNHKTISLEQKKLSDILSENLIDEVDYLSIDVEGYEMNVLESVDFSKVKIKVISIENDLGFQKLPFIGKRLGSELGDNKLRKYLKDRGYKYVARIVCDDFFIKE